MGYYVDDYGYRHEEYESPGGGDGFEKWFFKVIIIVVVIVLIKMLIEYLPHKLVELGILKPKVYFELYQDKGTGLDLEDISVILRQTDGDREYILDVSEDGTVEKNIRGGTYSVSLEANGVAQYLEDETYDLPNTYGLRINWGGLYTCAVILDFHDESGNPLMPENVIVSIDGDTDEAFPQLDGTYLILNYFSYAESGYVEITADGYEPVKLDYENFPRVSHISAVLKETS